MQEQTLGRRIQEARKAAGLSQESLGERLGVSRQAVSKWEADAAVPELENLIAMSRIFGVTIGALLGVEPAAEEPTEEDSPEAPGGESGDAAPDRELTDRELAAVEAIVQKYLEAAQAAGQPRWSQRRKVLAGAAICAVLALAVYALGSSFFSLENRLDQVQSQVYSIERSVGNQIGSLTGQLSGLLEEQTSLISDYQLQVTDYDLEEAVWYLTASVTPREYTAGTVVTFSAWSDTGETSTSSPAQNNSGIFTVENWAVPMASMPTRNDDGHPLDDGGEVQISVSFTGGGTTRTQTLETLYDNLASFQLSADGGWNTVWKQGALTFESLDLKIDNDTGIPVNLAEAELALFYNGESEPLWSMPFPAAVELWERQGYVQMLTPLVPEVSPLRLENGQTLLSAVRITDDHGQTFWYLLDGWGNDYGTLRRINSDALNGQWSSWQPGDTLVLWD